MYMYMYAKTCSILLSMLKSTYIHLGPLVCETLTNLDLLFVPFGVPVYLQSSNLAHSGKSCHTRLYSGF